MQEILNGNSGDYPCLLLVVHYGCAISSSSLQNLQAPRLKATPPKVCKADPRISGKAEDPKAAGKDGKGLPADNLAGLDPWKLNIVCIHDYAR